MKNLDGGFAVKDYVRKQPLVGVLLKRCSWRLIELGDGGVLILLNILTSPVKLLQLAKMTCSSSKYNS